MAVIGVAIIGAANFKNKGSKLSSPADLNGTRFCNSIKTSTVWMWAKEKSGRLTEGTVDSGEFIAVGKHVQPLQSVC